MEIRVVDGLVVGLLDYEKKIMITVILVTNEITII